MNDQIFGRTSTILAESHRKSFKNAIASFTSVPLVTRTGESGKIAHLCKCLRRKDKVRNTAKRCVASVFLAIGRNGKAGMVEQRITNQANILQNQSLEWPRMLFVTASVPSTGTASGLILMRLLEEVPADRLMIVGPPPPSDSEVLPCRYVKTVKPFQRLHNTRFRLLAKLELSLEAAGILPHVRVATIQEGLGDFHPDVVIALSERGYHRAAQKFAKANGLPLILILHDRYELMDPVFGGFESIRRRRDASVYRSAVKRLCISEPMEQFFRSYYGAVGDVMYPIKADRIVPRDAQAVQLRQPARLTLAYAGTFGFGYGSQLISMADVFRASGTVVYLFCRPSPEIVKCIESYRDVFTLREFGLPEMVCDRIRKECDGTLLPYGVDTARAQLALYQTHFPSKLTDYTSLAMPIVIVGPASASGVMWGLKNPESAMILAAEQPHRWVEQLSCLRETPELRLRLASNAFAAGCRDFATATIRQQFHDCVKSTVQQKSRSSVI